jgi:hypothetical protein
MSVEHVRTDFLFHTRMRLVAKVDRAPSVFPLARGLAKRPGRRRSTPSPRAGLRQRREAANVAGASGLAPAGTKKSPREAGDQIISVKYTLGVGGETAIPFAKQTISMADSGRFPPSVKYLLSGAGAISRGRASGAILPRRKPKPQPDPSGRLRNSAIAAAPSDSSHSPFNRQRTICT